MGTRWSRGAWPWYGHLRPDRGQGESICGTTRALEWSGVASPSDKGVWAKPTIKAVVTDDVYRTLDHAELQGLVAAEQLTSDVLGLLDRDKR